MLTDRIDLDHTAFKEQSDHGLPCLQFCRIRYTYVQNLALVCYIENNLPTI